MEGFQIIYEDNHLIVVNKEAGILVQGDQTGDIPLSEMLKEYIRVKYDKPGNVFCGVVHRLDRPVSGLVVFARTSKALERMTKVFHDRHVQKTYWALVKERPEQDEDTLVHWLVKDHDRNVTKAFLRPEKEAQRAELRYTIRAKVNRYYLLEIEPLTGRPHQIRVQLAKIGCPIKGDLKYGYPEKNSDGSISLHARKLSFEHPTRKEPMAFTARVPVGDQVWRDFAHL